jgi:hypothetical protein
MSARSAGTAICDVHVEARRMHDVFKQNLPYIYLFSILFVRAACLFGTEERLDLHLPNTTPRP